MRRSRIRACLLSAGLAAALFVGSGDARAEADSFGLGSGHDGALVVAATGQVVNTYAQVKTAIAAGATTFTIGAPTGAAGAFTPGQVVMIFQARGGLAAPFVSGSGTTIALTSASKTGRYELARIATIAGSTVTLTHATVNAFDANDSQIVSVPEYTTVTINAGASLIAQAWDGTQSTGGVLAFLATGAIANDGEMDVAGRGFAGGLHLQNTLSNSGCAALDGTPVGGTALAGGAHKGEGLDASGYGRENTYAGATAHHFGRGNVGNAGGGGDCFNSGGAGGGHGAKGGGGGDTNSNVDLRRAVGGEGGAPVTYDPATNLVFGGGGGAGEDDDGVGGSGGAGGGVVWFRADSMTGVGAIVADGANGGSAGPAGDPTFADGGGGGGAGGGVFGWLHGAATCGGITANGGKGGDAQPVTPGRTYGPGGGGAGGVVKIASAAGGACFSVENAGAAGLSGATSYGASAGTAGSSSTAAAFTTTTCDVVTGKCGGCAADSYCPPATSTCVTNASAAQYTCIAAADYGLPPSGGQTCVAGGVPTQGTSQGCKNDLCDTSDNDCGYANGTACTLDDQCRANACEVDKHCGLALGSSCMEDKNCRSTHCVGGVCTVNGASDAGADAGDASVDSGVDAGHDAGLDASADASSSDGGDAGMMSADSGPIQMFDGGTGNEDSGAGKDASASNEDDTGGASLEGGGISCNAAPESPSNVLFLLGVASLVGVTIRRFGKNKKKKKK